MNSRDELVDLAISGSAHGGVSVARLDGRVVFVPDTLPGERVRARLTDVTKRSFWRAEVLDVIDASPHRREHIWREAAVDRAPEERAGGADFGHIVPDHQRALKSRVLSDALQRFAGIETDVPVESIEDDEQRDGVGWRTRMRVHVAPDGTVGPYASRSHTVVSVAGYPLATDAVASAAPDAVPPGTADWIDIVDRGSEQPLVLPGRGRAAAGAVITETVSGRPFSLDAAGFWQVHRRAPQVLSDAVRGAVRADEFDPEAANLDLYGGVGLLAAALAEAGGPTTRVTSVEAFRPATIFAHENLAEWPNARAETVRVDRYLRTIVDSADAREREQFRRATVVLDPPRQGAGAEVVTALGALAPATIVYVACDPVALARDLGTFRELGYEADRMTAFDLFPNTHHFEVVAVLRSQASGPGR